MAAVFMITTSTVVIDPYGHRPALGRIYRVLTGGGASLRKLFYQMVYRGISRVGFPHQGLHPDRQHRGKSTGRRGNAVSKV